MKFFIMGGTGFVGVPLVQQAGSLIGDLLKPGEWQEIAGQADVIINLVGRSIVVLQQRSRWRVFTTPSTFMYFTTYTL